MTVLLAPEQFRSLKEWFLPERPGPLIGMHVIRTGHGACFADRWPAPRALLVNAAGNYFLAGDPQALEPSWLKQVVAGFVDAPPQFIPLLRAAFPDLKVWDRVVFELTTPPRFVCPPGVILRRLEASDAFHLWGLSPESAWICKTWGGPPGLAASGYAWGAFAEDRLLSLACTFFAGESYEDLGVVTEPGHRGKGLSMACTGALCEEVSARGLRPSWTTSPDNLPSLRLVERLGFSPHRRDYLYVAAVPIPAPAARD